MKKEIISNKISFVWIVLESFLSNNLISLLFFSTKFLELLIIEGYIFSSNLTEKVKISFVKLGKYFKTILLIIWSKIDW